MSDFERLHPALQHHVVSSLGWPRLRPLQEAAIGPVLDGEDALLIAPTAGGKTEAAVLPILSRLARENWPRLSVVYVCPIKALLNNLLDRLGRLAGFVGRRVGIWHGDVGMAARRKLVKDPPQLLLTTPESLEVMLISSQAERTAFLADLRVVVVDEIHAFAGDDRGWHLLAVLERLVRMTGRPLQRLGLSATVGNPAELAAWIAGPARTPARVVAPPAPPTVEAEVTLDHVGGLRNAATVIHRLHRDEKRLVFCDSRVQVEELAGILRGLGTAVFVSHSSLSAAERRAAEAAFAAERDCVIVATSTLELGIDVGDLDRVVQIDCPPSVASFLQRMGRTGRRPGTRRNCLFLATDEDHLLFAAGLVALWSRGEVEAIRPPPRPYHVLAQQFLALALQQHGVGRALWAEWLGGLTRAAGIPECEAEAILDALLAQGYLIQDSGVMLAGPKLEEEFGRRHYRDLCSVFAAEPLFAVLHGREEIGKVHPTSFAGRQERDVILSLGGRGWQLTAVDWKRQRAEVLPVKTTGRSRWLGSGRPRSYAHAQEVKRVLLTGEVPVRLTQRATQALAKVRSEMDFVRGADPILWAEEGERAAWYSFGGLRANRMLATLIGSWHDVQRGSDNLALGIDPALPRGDLITRLRRTDLASITEDLVPIDDEALEGLKFGNVLPRELAIKELKSRDFDPSARLLLGARLDPGPGKGPGS